MGSIGVVADDNTVCLIQVGDLNLRPDEPFWQYNVQSAKRLVNCGAADISYVPNVSILEELEREIRAAGAEWWSVKIPDDVTPQTHRHSLRVSQPVFTANSQSLTDSQLRFSNLPELVSKWDNSTLGNVIGEFVCIYDNQEPYKGWVAADVTYKTFRPLWAKIEELRVAQRLWTQPLNTTQSSQLLLRQLISIYPLASR